MSVSLPLFSGSSILEGLKTPKMIQNFKVEEKKNNNKMKKVETIETNIEEVTKSKDALINNPNKAMKKDCLLTQPGMEASDPKIETEKVPEIVSPLKDQQDINKLLKVTSILIHQKQNWHL